MNILLSTAYFPPIQYFSYIYSAKKVLIEGFEHFPKQTYRNRCIIYSANGPLSLSVPVTKGDNLKVYTNEIKIDYSVNWQKNHLRAIESAYRCSPFYEYYIDEIAPFFKKHFDRLIDFNTEILIKTCTLIGIPFSIDLTNEFSISAPLDFNDLRFSMHPKINKNKFDPNYILSVYRQVFEPKLGFIENLSIIDLIFNTGPDSIEYLKQKKPPLSERPNPKTN